MGFCENLKSEIDYQGIKIKDLAEKSGVNKRTIDHYLLKEPQEPSVSNAYKIAKVLKVSVEFLMTGNDTNLLQYASKESLSYLRKIDSLDSQKKELLFNLIDVLYNKAN